MEYEALDKEHQALADLVNQVVKAINGNESGKCKSLVKQFVELAKEHFSNEEALLLKTGFPNFKKHQEHHKNLTIKMDHIIEFANMADANQLARDSLRKELVFFLMDDIITTDMDFKAFIEEKSKLEETKI
tara:strand:- start:48 stop:440 length:393 start_codon:yes stop_codon:yes gene_type:complete